MDIATPEAHLEPRLVGDIAGRFYVPAYQRGYRWGREEVTRLLQDIWESRDRPYYLQPVVVKRHGDEWELIDGQQRLTTLYLIFKYMQDEGLQSTGAGYTMRYETRPGSADYLEQPDPELSDQNIDFFHIFAAYGCIRDWFEAQGHRRQFVANAFYSALFEHVRVIWYEVGDQVDANTLFRRLNVGRIPLTDAELVKALLLSHSRDVDGTDRAWEIAAQWDTFERDLREPEVWAFITGRPTGDATHIDLLLDTLAGGPTGRDRPPFHTFNTLRERVMTGAHRFWNDVVEVHATALGWHANRDLFHKVGYLVSTQAATFRQLLERSRRKTKTEFEAELDELIRQQVKLSATELRELTYTNSDKTSRVLLLANVERIRQRRHSSERYSFREHAAGRWSLEHIHAQSAEGIRRTQENWRTWLAMHRRALQAVDGIDPDQRDRLLSQTDETLSGSEIKHHQFAELEQQYTTILSLDDDLDADSMHSIGNLTLLDSSDNSALGNSVFAVKRKEILDRDREGYYIPVCTREVFLKYYSPADEHQMHFWSSRDREHYLDALESAVGDYLIDEAVTA